MEKSKLFIATMAEDSKSSIKKYKLGVELDQFCTAYRMEGNEYEVAHKEVMEIMKENPSLKVFIHGPFNELHPAAIDPKVIELMYYRLNQAYDLTMKYGSQDMIVHSGYLPYVYMKSWHIDRSCEFWEKFMENKAASFNIYIENVLEDEPEMMADMMARIKDKRIKICLDTGHANCMSKVPVLEWIDVLSPYIGHFHIHNNDGIHDKHNSPQEGLLDFKEIFKRIEESCNKNATFTLETRKSEESLKWMVEEGILKL